MFSELYKNYYLVSQGMFTKGAARKSTSSYASNECPEIRTIAPRGKLPPGQCWSFGQGKGQFQGWGATRQLPRKKIDPWLGLVFGLGAIFLEGNCPRTMKGTNFKIHFSFKNAELKKQWIRFDKRRDFLATKHLVLCELHFEKKYLRSGEKCHYSGR